MFVNNRSIYNSRSILKLQNHNNFLATLRFRPVSLCPIIPRHRVDLAQQPHLAVLIHIVAWRSSWQRSTSILEQQQQEETTKLRCSTRSNSRNNFFFETNSSAKLSKRCLVRFRRIATYSTKFRAAEIQKTRKIQRSKYERKCRDFECTASGRATRRSGRNVNSRGKVRKRYRVKSFFEIEGKSSLRLYVGTWPIFRLDRTKLSIGDRAENKWRT